MYPYRHYDSRDFKECGEIKPASETKTILGVSADNADSNVILTYPHVVQVYKLSKVEPFNEVIREWNTKLNLTSAVVYDRTLNSYIGVFHNNTIRVWKPETTELTQTVKHTFQQTISRILPRPNAGSVVIFRNGNCVTLPYGLDNCNTFKAKALFKESWTIVNVSSYSRNSIDYVCYVVKDLDDDFSVITCPLKEETCDCSKIVTERVHRVVKKGEAFVTGSEIVSNSVNPYIYFTWSDSCVSKYNVVRRDWKHHKLRFNCFRSDVELSCVGKNFFFFYAKNHWDEMSQIFVPHIDFKGGGRNQILDSYWKYTKIYTIGEFVILVELRKITVFNVICHDDVPRQSH